MKIKTLLVPCVSDKINAQFLLFHIVTLQISTSVPYQMAIVQKNVSIRLAPSIVVAKRLASRWTREKQHAEVRVVEPIISEFD